MSYLRAALLATFASVAPALASTQEYVVLDKYTCSEFLRDAAEPNNGARLLRSLMMVSWASGFAAAHQEGTPRADPRSIQLIALTLGDACRKDPKQFTVAAISKAISAFNIQGNSPAPDRKVFSAVTTSKPIQQQTRDFLDALYAANSQATPEFVASMKDIYADQVEYFGKNLSRDNVLTQLSAYLDRWPQRKYVPRPASVKIQCDETARTCTTAGVLDFETANPARDERWKGEASFEFTLSYQTSTGPKIIREAGSTIIRNRLPTASKSSQ